MPTFAPQADPVALPDCQLNWEQLKSLFKLLVSVPSGKSNIALNFGTVTLNWAAARNSGVVVVSHGLGHTPSVVLATPLNSPQAALGQIPQPNIIAPGATSFSIDAEVQVAFNGNQTIGWLAVG